MRFICECDHALGEGFVKDEWLMQHDYFLWSWHNWKMLIVVVTEVNEHAIFFFHFSQTRRSSHAGHEYGLRHARANRLKWRHNRVRSHARANRSRKKSVTRCLPDSYVSTCFDTPVPSLWSCVWVLMFALVFDIKEAWSRIFNNPSNCFELWHRTKGNDRLILCVMCKFSCLCSQGGEGSSSRMNYLPPRRRGRQIVLVGEGMAIISLSYLPSFLGVHT